MTDIRDIKTIDAALLMNVMRAPDRVVAQDVRGALDAKRLAGAAWLLSQKLKEATQAPAVAVCMPTLNEYIVAIFACAMAGKSCVPVNFLLQPRELAHIFKDSGAGLVITSSHFAEKLGALGVPMLRIEEFGAEAAKVPASEIKPQPCATPNPVAILLYTSGTTALPKGVKLTHGNLLAQMDMFGKAFDLSHFHLLSALPMFHTFAVTCCALLPALTPARVSLLPQFDPAQMIESLPKFGANVLLGVPSMYRMIGRAAKRAGKDCKALGVTMCIAGGEKLPKEVYEEWEATMGVPLLEGFGMTEHSPAISVNLPHDNVPGTIGKPLPGNQWRVVDDAGNVLPPGKEGELQLKSASVMAGYHNTPDEAQPFTADGWLKSGDLAVIDADGRGTITGRIKDLIIAAGKNIHPTEIEEVAYEYTGVGECAAIGIPDKTRGEAPALFVVAKEGAAVDLDGLREHLHQKLAEYKRPRLVKLVPELPHTPTGKVLRRALKPLVEQALAAGN